MRTRPGCGRRGTPACRRLAISTAAGTCCTTGTRNSVVHSQRRWRRGGVQCLALPARSPSLNAHAERWVQSIKTECLSMLILFGEASRRRAVAEFLTHYLHERNHQGKGNVILFPASPLSEDSARGAVTCKERAACRSTTAAQLNHPARTPMSIFTIPPDRPPSGVHAAQANPAENVPGCGDREFRAGSSGGRAIVQYRPTKRIAQRKGCVKSVAS